MLTTFEIPSLISKYRKYFVPNNRELGSNQIDTEMSAVAFPSFPQHPSSENGKNFQSISSFFAFYSTLKFNQFTFTPDNVLPRFYLCFYVQFEFKTLIILVKTQ